MINIRIGSDNLLFCFLSFLPFSSEGISISSPARNIKKAKPIFENKVSVLDPEGSRSPSCARIKPANISPTTTGNALNLLINNGTKKASPRTMSREENSLVGCMGMIITNLVGMDYVGAQD
jgi:hypothetical protein